MLSYLRFMKYADTDQQLLDLHTEVSELRVKINNLDQFTASQMQEKVGFKEVVYESFGFPEFTIDKSDPKRHFTQKTSVAEIKKEIKPRKSKYIGVSFSTQSGKWCTKIQHKGITYLNSQSNNTEEEAVRQRDLTIIKYHLPFPLQLLKKSDQK